MERQPPTVLVDADACPVKDEVYRVAQRHKALVFVVSNSPFRVPGAAAPSRTSTAGGPRKFVQRPELFPLEIPRDLLVFKVAVKA